MKKIGFLINPIAGMGGTVGLKGTDNNLVEEAIRLGAKPISRERARITLSALKGRIAEEYLFLTCSGLMGGNLLKELNFTNYKLVCYTGEKTSAEDTKNACEEFLKRKVDLILFCGGDGTARDIYVAVKRKVPILGIPSGVKMYSSVFALNPEISARVIEKFLKNKAEIQEEGEIMDINEEKFRDNKLEGKLVGYASVPNEKEFIQESKMVFHSSSDEKAKEEIAKFASEFILLSDDSLYILCPGSTIKKIADFLGIKKTLLGVDVVKNKQLIAKDVNEEELLKLLRGNLKVKILVSPLGAQGFIFGRGNQQVSREVIRKVGVKNVIILATPLKLSQTPCLFVDTGDTGLDKRLSGFKQVISGYRMVQKKEIKRL